MKSDCFKHLLVTLFEAHTSGPFRNAKLGRGTQKRASLGGPFACFCRAFKIFVRGSFPAVVLSSSASGLMLAQSNMRGKSIVEANGAGTIWASALSVVAAGKAFSRVQRRGGFEEKGRAGQERNGVV